MALACPTTSGLLIEISPGGRGSSRAGRRGGVTQIGLESAESVLPAIPGGGRGCGALPPLARVFQHLAPAADDRADQSIRKPFVAQPTSWIISPRT
jgi:hypothetical protein